MHKMFHYVEYWYLLNPDIRTPHMALTVHEDFFLK